MYSIDSKLGKMVNISSHTVSSSAFGYLYQPHRALLRLAQTKSEQALIGVEAFDDVSKVKFKTSSGQRYDTIEMLEQDKTSLSSKSSLFSNRSHSLWNTLYIWIKEYEKGRFDVDKIELAFVTNRQIPENYLVKQLSEAESIKEVEDIVDKLFKNINSPSEKVQKQVKYIKQRKKKLKLLVPKIVLLDGLDLKKCDKLIKQELHLISEIADEMITALKGWVYEQTMNKWENGEPAFISKRAFNRAKYNIEIRANKEKAKERSRSVVESQLKQQQIKVTQEELFVEQLEAITDSEEDDIIFDAIKEYLCTDIERTRLVKRGDVLEEDLESFDQRCKRRWKQVFRKHRKRIRNAKNPEDYKDIGYDIYYDTTFGWCCPLGGIQTTETYFTKGAFHNLASVPKIGWHPKWEKKFNK